MNEPLLDQILPFHLKLSREGRITSVGPSLAKLLPHARDRLLDDLLTEPTEPTTASIQRLHFQEPAFALRGTFVARGDGWLFVSMLDPDAAPQIAELGLSASDFAANDLTIELSMLKWTSDSRLAETQALLEQLRESNKNTEILRLQTRTDPLTGIPNRVGFLETLDAAISRNADIEILMLDLNRFKSINDLHGQRMGDKLLNVIAEELTSIVGDGGMVARMGGDEFGVLLVGQRECQSATTLARNIAKLNDRAVTIDDVELSVSLTLGRVHRTNETEAGALIRHADIAMHTARRAHGTSIGLFDPAAQRELSLRRSIANDLPQALTDRQIRMHYQPIVRLSDFRIVSYEVLSRWTHPVHGTIPPDLFVEVAESCRLVDEFDRYVVATALKEVTENLVVAGELPRLSINFSALSLTDDLTQYLSDALQRSTFPASKLSVEVTETASIRDLERTTRVLTELDRSGMTVALDDFGTGFSSLTYLQQLPIGALKIDRSFVMDMLASRKALELVRSILHVATSLGLPVVAEGIETVEQATMLRNLGCELGQGYYFARPGPIEEIAALRGGTLPVKEDRQPSAAATGRGTHAVTG